MLQAPILVGPCPHWNWESNCFWFRLRLNFMLPTLDPPFLPLWRDLVEPSFIPNSISKQTSKDIASLTWPECIVCQRMGTSRLLWSLQFQTSPEIGGPDPCGTDSRFSPWIAANWPPKHPATLHYFLPCFSFGNSSKSSIQKYRCHEKSIVKSAIFWNQSDASSLWNQTLWSNMEILGKVDRPWLIFKSATCILKKLNVHFQRFNLLRNAAQNHWDGFLPVALRARQKAISTSAN